MLVNFNVPQVNAPNPLAFEQQRNVLHAPRKAPDPRPSGDLQQQGQAVVRQLMYEGADDTATPTANAVPTRNVPGAPKRPQEGARERSLPQEGTQRSASSSAKRKLSY